MKDKFAQMLEEAEKLVTLLKEHEIGIASWHEFLDASMTTLNEIYRSKQTTSPKNSLRNDRPMGDSRRYRLKRNYQVLQEPALEEVEMKAAATEACTKIRGFVKTLARSLADITAWTYAHDASGPGVKGTMNGAEILIKYFQTMASLYVDDVEIRLREEEQIKLSREVGKLRERMRRIPEKIAIAKLEAKPVGNQVII